MGLPFPLNTGALDDLSSAKWNVYGNLEEKFEDWKSQHCGSLFTDKYIN